MVNEGRDALVAKSEARVAAGKKAWAKLPAAEKKRRLAALAKGRKATQPTNSQGTQTKPKKKGGKPTMASKNNTPKRTKKREYHIPKALGAGVAGTGVAILTGKDPGQRSALEYLKLGNPQSAFDRAVIQAKKTSNYIPAGAGAAVTTVVNGTKIGRKLNNKLPPWARL